MLEFPNFIYRYEGRTVDLAVDVSLSLYRPSIPVQTLVHPRALAHWATQLRTDWSSCPSLLLDIVQIL